MRRGGWFSLVSSFVGLAPIALGAATLTVTTTSDSGAGSLRQAILDSNASAGVVDTIAFAIPGGGVQTISPATALPTVTDPVVIDGTTQPGFNGSPLIELAGTSLGAFDYGLIISAGGSTVRGLVVNRFGGGGIQLNTGDGNTIVGNFIGTDATGAADLGNGTGVYVFSGSDGNTIGGTSPPDRNLISGNNITGVALYTPGNNVLGNRIGTDVTGLAAVDNATGLSDNSGGNAIGGSFGTTPGGPCTGACNLISGNFGVAIQLSAATPSTVEGNYIGTDVTGLDALGNGSYGIAVFAGTGHSVFSNLVSANFLGIGMNAGPGVVIRGNFVGTDATGTAALPNEYAGVGAFNGADGTIIGGGAGAPGTACVFPCNLISGNTGYGITLGTGGSSIGQEDDVIQGNCIGTQVDCLSPLPNGTQGIEIGFQASDETIGGNAAGEGNVIAFNGSNGINVGTGERNTIRGNSVFQNEGLGIDLGGGGVTPNDPGDGDGGANLLQNYPIITSVEPALAAAPQGASTRIQGFLRGAAATELDLDFYSNSACADRPQEFLEGRTYLGSTTVTTDGTGLALLDVTLPVDVAANDPISATATDPLGNTSEFSQRLPLFVFPTSGPPAGGSPLTITGTDFQAGATVMIGGVAAGNVVVNNSNSISATSPLLPAGTVNDLTVANLDGSEGTLPKAWVADFLDVPFSNNFYSFVTTLVRNAITVGIGGGLYGVNDDTLRQQMAVFLLKAKFGLCYTPPPCTGVFTDVPCSSSFAPWIEALADLGITGGCGANVYCPQNPVRRDQMAVFLLKAKYGLAYTPPPCTGVFPDVPCPSQFANWIEQLAEEDITEGCGSGNYCPLNPNTRGQMAVFIVKAFNLQ